MKKLKQQKIEFWKSKFRYFFWDNWSFIILLCFLLVNVVSILITIKYFHKLQYVLSNLITFLLNVIGYGIYLRQLQLRIALQLDKLKADYSIHKCCFVFFKHHFILYFLEDLLIKNFKLKPSKLNDNQYNFNFFQGLKSHELNWMQILISIQNESFNNVVKREYFNFKKHHIEQNTKLVSLILNYYLELNSLYKGKTPIQNNPDLNAQQFLSLFSFFTNNNKTPITIFEEELLITDWQKFQKLNSKKFIHVGNQLSNIHSLMVKNLNIFYSEKRYDTYQNYFLNKAFDTNLKNIQELTQKLLHFNNNAKYLYSWQPLSKHRLDPKGRLD